MNHRRDLCDSRELGHKLETHLLRNQINLSKAEIASTSKDTPNEVTERLTDVGKNKPSTKNNTAKITKRERLLANLDVK